jgi:hypothetical protein
MEIEGKLLKKSNIEQIQKKDGSATYQKMFFVIEQKGQYPRPLSITIFNKEPLMKLINDTNIGSELVVSADAESREHKERWYTDFTAWKIEITTSGDGYSSQPESKIEDNNANTSTDANSDLPF